MRRHQPLAVDEPDGDTALLSPVSLPASLLAPPQKFDYDSSSVRKRFFREALLQIFVPYMLKQLAPSCVHVSLTRPPPCPPGWWRRPVMAVAVSRRSSLASRR